MQRCDKNHKTATLVFHRMQQSPTYTSGSILGAMLRLSIPVVIGNLLQTAYQITDTFWVGRLSAEAVAAVSLSFPVNFLFISLGGGLSLAGTVLVAQYKGREDRAMMNHTAAQTLLMVFAISIILSTIGYVLSEQIMRLMGAESEVLPDAVRYMRVNFLSFVFVFAYFVYQSLMRGIGIVKVPMFIVLFTVILNLFLDPLFIFGYGSIPAMGVAGAAMATLTTQAIATLIGLFLMFRVRYGFTVTLNDLKPDWSFMRKAFHLGWPASVEQSTRALGATVMTMLVASFGTIAVAAYGIGIRVFMLVHIPAMGLSMSTSVLVGQNMGAGKPERASRTNVIGSTLAFAILTAAGVILFVFAHSVCYAFMPEGGVAIAVSVAFVRIMSLTFGFIGIQNVITGTLRGAGDTRAAMMLTIVTFWIVQFPLAYILAYHTSLGVDGIWWAFPVANVLAAIIALMMVWRGTWKQKNIIPDAALREQVHEEVTIDEGAGA